MGRRKKSHQSHGTAQRPRLWGKHAVAAALDNPDRKVLKAWATRDAAAMMQFPAEVAVTLADVADLGRLVPHDAAHQGLVVEVEPLDEVWLDELLTGAGEQAVLLVLDQVTDPHNVGEILRTAAAYALDGIVTTERHSPAMTGVLAKAASGGLEHVPIVTVVNLARALETLGKRGYLRVGLDSEGPRSLEDEVLSKPLALVLGAEGKGLRRLSRENCDVLARIDMPGAIKSLNVSNACAVALTIARLKLR